ncbi:peptide-methionine (S)-S-oxide reductase [Candidatus Parcubacteria bacterium]|jgi:peptide-methionine (S)-S-oxide reductase|nr:MAG: peptide-methionine (S)-S-oxide reductase [Candidatus Parcubacteria bacterium]
MSKPEYITLGGGCFWYTEAILKELKGVIKITSGYAGGSVENPTYEQVCSGTTGHAEVVQVEFDPEVITLEKLLEILFATHDPTTLNRQGNDVGEQYRSVVFYQSEGQKNIAENLKARLEAEKVFERPIIMQILPMKNFYPAEGYHADYFANNPKLPYCQIVISPKLIKFRKRFRNLLK